MKIASVVGARPQFIKAAVVHRALLTEKIPQHVIIHTGQHYDHNMSKVFFDDLEIPRPDFNLEVGSASHGLQTARMLERIEKTLMTVKPDWCVLYGDTNSTVAGALAAAKLQIPVAHVEAGLRSFNRKMPEELNRIATDHLSDLLFAPTTNAIGLLEKEGLKERAFLSGDVMYDSILFYSSLIAGRKPAEMEGHSPFFLATIHRQENTDDSHRLSNIFKALGLIDKQIILPLHPRTAKQLTINHLNIAPNIKIIDPVGYLDMIALLTRCEKVLTDSGGLQKEAYFLKKPCITLRDETEWVETLEGNWNFLAGSDVEAILRSVNVSDFGPQSDAFGNGDAGRRIVRKLLEGRD